jgi:molybdenum cofactor cytidylyltransferase
VISGIVLAAGTSSRLGRPKQLLELDGRPLLQHVIDAAATSMLDEIIVVLGHEAVAIASALDLPASARTVINPDFRVGQSTSLRAGLEASARDSDAALVLLGDQPGVTPSLIDGAIAAFRASPRPLLRALFEGQPGHPVVIARSHWRALDEGDEDAGARGLLARASAEVTEVELGPPLPDVDTWDDYEALRRAGDPSR